MPQNILSIICNEVEFSSDSGESAHNEQHMTTS